MKPAIRICSALLFSAAVNLAAAQSYPVKPVRLIFPLLPGSASNDILVRAIVVAGDPLRNRSCIFRQNFKQGYATSKRVRLPAQWDAPRNG